MSNKIDILVENGLIEKSKADYIKEKFQDFTSTIEEWSDKANAIVVSDETQTEIMTQAREGRLLLKAKRIEVEKVRKSLKEQSLNEGRLIDSVAKYLTGLIEPAEKHLELQEKFIEINEQNKRIQLKIDRTKLLQPYKDVIDPDSIQLDLITEEAFTTILNGAKFALDNKKAEKERADKEREENEIKQKLFQHRSLQIARYKTYWDSDKDIILTPETTETNFNILLKNLINREEEEVSRQQAIIKENDRLKKQSENQKKQIKELKTIKKIDEKSNIVTQLTITKKEIKETSDFIETQNENFILVNKEDYEILKKRYGIAKTVLESVLCFIVPQNLRDLANKAMVEIAEAGNDNKNNT
jgi:hypothetical protein